MTEVVFALLAIAMVLTLVSLLVPVAERLRLPHTVLLAVCGLFLGFVGNWVVGSGQFLGVVRDAFRGLHNFEVGAEVLLSLFLPPLLFTAALTIDVRRLLDEFAAVLLLAVVAVLVCIAIVGGVVHLATGYDIVVCLLLGAVVSTTDPAAVIGIFRDVGAPKRLSILAEGEALFNDAAAITTFGILIGILVNKIVPDAASPGIDFSREFLGGIAVGFVLGRITMFVLPRIGESDAAIMSLTVSLAYFSFILSAQYLHVSGVVAVVVAGLTVAAYGPTHLHARAWLTLRQTWHQLEFWANCLIFVFAAMLAADTLTRISAAYAWGLLALIVSAFAARALVVFGMFPLLVSTRLVQPISQRYKAILVWGGLRGAVTIVLALVAAGDTRLPIELREFVSVLATLFVLFTLFVNAPSLRLLMRVFELNKLSPTELVLRDRVIELSRANAARQMRLATRLDPLATEAELKDAMSDKPLEALPAAHDWKLNLGERVTVGLLTLCTREKDLYLEHFEQQTLSRRMVAILAARADALIDSVKSQGAQGYDLALRQIARPALPFRIALWLHRRLGWEKPLTKQLADRFETLIVSQSVLAEATEFNREAVGDLLGYDAGERLEALLAERCELVDRALKALSLQYPGYAEAVHARHVERAAIRFEAAEYSRRLRESTISREVYDDLRASLGERRKSLTHRPPLRLGLELAGMISRVPLFTGLSAQDVVEMGSLLRAQLAIPEEKVVAVGQPADAMYFIAAGTVRVELVTGPIVLGEGDFFGEMGLLSSQPRNADVVANGYCQLLVLSKRDFNRLLAGRPQLRAEIEAVAARRIASPAAQSATA